MVPLNYNQLYYFFKIAESGSIARASKEILISSPALSMQLKDFEESLGTPLFLRSGKKMLLTDAGTLVFGYARDIFHLGLELKDTVTDLISGPTRMRVEIGCQDTISKVLLDQLLALLLKEKSCKVILREGNQDRLRQMQNDYNLDLILTNSAPQIDQLKNTRRVDKEELFLFGHSKFKKFQGQLISALTQVPLILPTYDSSCRNKLDHYFREHSLRPDVLAEVEDKATEMELALQGHGLFVSPRSGVKDENLIEIGKIPYLFEEVWLSVCQKKKSNPLAQFAFKHFTPHHR